MSWKNSLFNQTKTFSFVEIFLTALESCFFLQAKSLSFSEPFLIYCYSKQLFFTSNTANSHPAITYCSPKNSVVFFIFAPNPHAVTPEPRTDSKPFRRRLVRKAGFDTCRRKLLQDYFRQSFESSPESRGSQTSGVLLVLFVQAKRIKLFPFGKFRGSTNLDSARRNSGFAQTKLKPSKKKIRGSANLESVRRSRSFVQTN